MDLVTVLVVGIVAVCQLLSSTLLTLLQAGVHVTRCVGKVGGPWASQLRAGSAVARIVSATASAKLGLQAPTVPRR